MLEGHQELSKDGGHVQCNGCKKHCDDLYSKGQTDVMLNIDCDFSTLRYFYVKDCCSLITR